MVQHAWPGNVREFENCVERAVIMSRDVVIDPNELKRHMNRILGSGAESVRGPILESIHDSLPGNVRAIEREQITDALRQCGGVQARAAKLLGLTPRQIGYKIRKYNIA